MGQARKKVLYVITKSNFGGAQRYVYDLATHLPHDEFESVVALGKKGILEEKLNESGIRSIRVENFERDISLMKDWGAFIELFAIIKKERPDIVHVNSSKAGGLGALASRMCGVKRIIFTAHGWPFYERRNVLWRMLVWILSYVTVVLSHKTIVVSRHDYQGAHMPFTRDALELIYTGVSPVSYLPPQEAYEKLIDKAIKNKKNDFLFVTTSELTPNKNLLTLLQAFKLFIDTCSMHALLVVIGTGEEREKLRKYVKEHELTTKVYFTGYVENVRSYLRAFDAFVIPSRKEGLPYGLLEAGSAALPVIGSSVGGIPEVIDTNVSGILIDPDNTEEIAHALCVIAKNKVARDNYAHALEHTVATQFSLPSMLDKTRALYLG